MNSAKIIFFILTLVTLYLSMVSCSEEKGRIFISSENRSSLVSLIATPDLYNAKLVQTYGYARIDYENTAVYLSEADANYGVMVSSIWLALDFAQNELEDWKKYDKKWVLIEGTFRKGKKGHFGMFAGTIENIQRIEILSETEEVESQ